MEDAKEKNVELSPEDLDKVSGGYINRDMRQEYYRDGDSKYKTVSTEIRCDMCSKYRGDENNPVVPFQGGHLCLDCIKKVEEKLDRKIL